MVFLAHVHLGIALATALGLVERLALIAFIEAIINLVTSIVLDSNARPFGGFLRYIDSSCLWANTSRYVVRPKTGIT